MLDIVNERVPSSEEHAALQSALIEHPYSAAIHALYAKSAKLRNDSAFEKIAVESAIRAGNRKALHAFVFEENTIAETVQATEPTEEKMEQSTAEQTDSKPSQKERTREEPLSKLDELDRQLISEAIGAGAVIDLISDYEEASEKKQEALPTEKAEEHTESVEKKGPIVEPAEPSITTPEKMRFSSWMSSLNDEVKAEKHETSTKPKLIRSKTPVETMSIIDHFIENEESLVPKHAEFFSPGKAAKKSLIDNDEIVSETLAQVYTAQGNHDKAISTYEKLSLRHPEKSAYFAALISRLKQHK